MVTVAENNWALGGKMLFYYGGFPLDDNKMTDENADSVGLVERELDRLVGPHRCGAARDPC